MVEKGRRVVDGRHDVDDQRRAQRVAAATKHVGDHAVTLRAKSGQIADELAAKPGIGPVMDFKRRFRGRLRETCATAETGSLEFCEPSRTSPPSIASDVISILHFNLQSLGHDVQQIIDASKPI